MIDSRFAKHFAEEWVAAWNRRDLDAILSHYAEDFEFSSPFIAAVAGEPSGVLLGHTAMRSYWAKALARSPDLNFVINRVLLGVNSLVIDYRRHDHKTGAEYFEFNEERKVVRSSAHYAE